ncbi:MAG: hypothetical protein AUI14_08670 [Actinobacteria bacterium 13_2_20CM_2_71_6]|nr:MAG: hypothetical protein AUI14_08670 [Actinobacteria bacterium 13_2_20CM_2_71_6]
MTRPAITRLVAGGAAVLVVAAVSLLPIGPGQLAGAAPPAPAFSHTQVVTRAHLGADGSVSTVDTKTVTVTVSQTENLRGRQLIDVTWSGAHPTGGLVLDPNSQEASRQEYPVVILQCRGVESTGAAANQRPDPSTCWTQTPPERYQADNNTAYPAFRMDRFAAPADRHAVVGWPGANVCPSAGSPAERYVPFAAADGQVYYGGANGRCGKAPEASIAPDPAAPPANTTYGVTGLDGTGSAKFVLWTDKQNASLGCSDAVPCVLVIVPIMGIGCDVSGKAAGVDPADIPAAGPDADQATKDCTATGQYAPGELAPAGLIKGDSAVEGKLWWSASNWANRITVPLTFAPPPNLCDVVDPRLPVYLFGSELMSEATDQWSPAFCRDPRRFKFQHVRTGEPQAKSALATGSIPAALVSRPPDGGWSGPTVNAPIGVTGFAVSYAIDDKAKHPYTDLKLNPRLLAKLLSESYWALPGLGTDFAALPPDDPHHALATNPQDLSADPEFQALNPDLGTTTQFAASSTLLALNGNSDVIHALTSYLNADPEARAFLDGRPDPWGMVVNPAYKGIALPLEAWPLQDTFMSPTNSLDGCLNDVNGQLHPVPILPLVAAPMAALSAIAQVMQYAIANSAVKCIAQIDAAGRIVGGSLKPVGRQPPGSRFMLALTSLGDAQFLGLRTASLQSDASDVGAKFSNGNQRHFVGPTEDAMRAAMQLTTADTDRHVWPLDYAKLRTAPDAYPGTMVVYAAVPTTGLDHTTAADLAQLLAFAADEGQQPGLDQGKLPPGYLPMTAANGLGSLVAYTHEAADAVAAQKGAQPGVASGGPGSVGLPGAGGVPNPGASVAAAASPAQSPWKPGVDLPSGYTRAAFSQLAGWALPVVVLAGLLALVVAMVTPAGVTLRMASRISRKLARLVELRRNQ